VHSPHELHTLQLKKEKMKALAGSMTLPASIKEKETHWPKVP